MSGYFMYNGFSVMICDRAQIKNAWKMHTDNNGYRMVHDTLCVSLIEFKE